LTGALDYYRDKNTGHYISVCAIDYKDYEMKLVDSNPNKKYRGKHWVDIEEAYHSVHDKHRFLINA